MTKHWRPEGWDALDIYAATENIKMKGTDLVEAGANAMLKGLRKEGWRLDGDSVPPARNGYPEIHVPSDMIGYLVFIPDEAKK